MAVLGLAIVAVVSSLVGALVVVLYLRALNDRADARYRVLRAETEELRAETHGRYRALQRQLRRAGLLQITDLLPAGNAIAHNDLEFAATDLDARSVPSVTGRFPSQPPATMVATVQRIVAGDFAGAGCAPPTTTPSARRELVLSLGPRPVVPHLLAHAVGLVPCVGPVPEPCAYLLAGTALFHRDDETATAAILAGVAATLLARAHVASGPADIWLLAAELAHPFALLDDAPHLSRSRQTLG